MNLLHFIREKLSGKSLREANSVLPGKPLPKDNIKPYAFISYSHKNSGSVSQLAAYLEREEIPPWKDNRLEYGESWENTIFDRIHNCKVFLIVMSTDSINSTFINREIDTAIGEKKIIIPILMNGEPFERLKQFHYVNLLDTHKSTTGFIERLRDLLAPGTVPSIKVQQRRVENAVLRIFDIIYGTAKGVDTHLGIGFGEHFGVDLDRPLNDLDELDWTEVFLYLHQALPLHDFNHNLSTKYGVVFPTIRHFSNDLLSKLKWDEIRQLQ